MCGKTFVITVKSKEIKKCLGEIICFSEETIKINETLVETGKEDELKAIIRGTFLGAGSINNPENTYHLEIAFSNKGSLETSIKILEKLNVKVKEMITKNKYSIYIKEGEEISKFLALIGAGKAVMQFEDIRIQKEMRGKVNRLVNCESANLNKTLNASVEQISAIRKLQDTGKFNKLDDNLKEIAVLRLENPDMSLIDLGKLLKNPVGKSGVNYRLKKIIEIAKET